jgi:probable rRNA maturation factor
MEDDSEYDISTHRVCDLPAVDDAMIRRAVGAALSLHGCQGAGISIALVDDAEIARLNEKYLKHEGPTDVLSFDLDGDSLAGRVDGEIVASVETARRVAEERGGDATTELLLYLIHGTLHLLGHDDATSEEAATMHAKEDEVLQAIGHDPVWHGEGQG